MSLRYCLVDHIQMSISSMSYSYHMLSYRMFHRLKISSICILVVPKIQTNCYDARFLISRSGMMYVMIAMMPDLFHQQEWNDVCDDCYDARSFSSAGVE